MEEYGHLDGDVCGRQTRKAGNSLLRHRYFQRQFMYLLAETSSILECRQKHVLVIWIPRFQPELGRKDQALGRIDHVEGRIDQEE